MRLWNLFTAELLSKPLTCKITTWIYAFFSYNSQYVLVLLCYDRYFAVTNPFEYREKYLNNLRSPIYRTLVAMAVSACNSALLAISADVDERGYCTVHNKVNWKFTIFRLVVDLSSYFVIPVLALTYFNVVIARKVRLDLISFFNLQKFKFKVITTTKTFG